MLWITHACHFWQRILYVCVPCCLHSALISSHLIPALSCPLLCAPSNLKSTYWAIHFHNVFPSTCIQLSFVRAGPTTELRKLIEKCLLLSLWCKTWGKPLSSSTFSLPFHPISQRHLGGNPLGKHWDDTPNGSVAGRMGTCDPRGIFRLLHGISRRPQNSFLGSASCPVFLCYKKMLATLLLLKASFQLFDTPISC